MAVPGVQRTRVRLGRPLKEQAPTRTLEHMRKGIFLALAACLAGAVLASSTSARTTSSMRLTCDSPGKTTLSAIPKSAVRFRFTFWWANNGKTGKVVSGPAWITRSLVKQGRLWIHSMSAYAIHAMATVRMKSGKQLHVRATCH
jgi:hypothetical protein